MRDSASKFDLVYHHLRFALDTNRMSTLDGGKAEKKAILMRQNLRHFYSTTAKTNKRHNGFPY